MITYFFICTVLLLLSSVTAQDYYRSFRFEDEFFNYLSSFKTIFISNNGKIQHEQDLLILSCLQNYANASLITNVFPRFENTMSASRVAIQDCKLPLTPLTELFQTLNINATAVEMLRLSIKHQEALPQGNYTTGLSIKSLWIDTRSVNHRNYLIHNPNFFDPLANLINLKMYGTELIPLPKTIHLDVLSVHEYSIIKSWESYCEHLRELELRRLFPEDIPQVWPEKCSQLTSLRLRGLPMMAVERIMNSGINGSCLHLQNLLVHACNQDELPHTILNVAKDLLTDLPKTNATHLEIDLRGRTVDQMSASSERTYKHLIEGDLTDLWGISRYNTNVTVYLTSIDCDCENYWFVKCIRDLPHLLSLPGLLCSNSGREVLDEPYENIDCRKSIRERNCVLRQIGTEGPGPYHNNRTIKVDCHSGTKSEQLYPEYNVNVHTVSLNASGDQVTSLKYMSLSKWLRILDLRNNQIARLDANDSSRLFAVPERQVWLDGNIIICDCDNKPLLDALHEHSHQVVDFDALTCIDTGMPISSVTSFDVCQVGMRIAIAVSGVIAALILLVAIILWRKRQQVKIFLYARGWCLLCLTEEDVDSDRPYDAFLSFAHGDMEYVSGVLLPKMEGEPYSYRICVHYRDWPAGDWIPAQIMRSVSLSKRTVILLSRNFITSMWASLEFRYAMAQATKEGRQRILVLVLDDVLEQTLDAEIQGYLNFNTYLKCDDPWFWDKLRYAMPHRKRLPVAPVFAPSLDLEEVFMEPLTDS